MRVRARSQATQTSAESMKKKHVTSLNQSLFPRSLCGKMKDPGNEVAFFFIQLYHNDHNRNSRADEQKVLSIKR